MTVTIVTREQCGLAAPDEARLAGRTVTLIGVTVHCTVTPTTDPVSTWREIQHAEMAGYDPSHDTYGDIAYNDGITLDGRILEGRAHSWVGAHATSVNNLANRVTLGVAIIGTGAQITSQAQEALRVWLYLATLELGHRPLLFDHLDWKALGGISTACPDPPTVQFVAELRAEARS